MGDFMFRKCLHFLHKAFQERFSLRRYNQGVCNKQRKEEVF